MSRERLVLDTNVLIRYGLDQLSPRAYLSAVVLQEIAAGARDEGGMRLFGELGKEFDRSGRLLTPTGDDWYQAGRVLNALHRGLRTHRPAQRVVIPRAEQQRLLRDVLIARSAKRVNAGVVTFDVSDFEKIRRFCNVRVVPPERVLSAARGES